MTNSIVLSAINAVNGCKFFNLTYFADCGFPKKSGLDGIVKKVVIKSAQINYSYENAVNNRIAKGGGQATFTAQSLPWGTWFVENMVIEHKGEYYLRFYTSQSSRTNVEYFENDGTPCSPQRIADIKSYLASKTKPISATQSAAGLVTNQVQPKNVKFANILEITISGQTYTNPMPLTPAV